MNYLKDTLEYLVKLLEWWVIVMPWQEGIRVRSGKHVTRLKKGVYLKLPFVDSFYVKTTRLMITGLPVQTITSKDGKTISVMAVVGFSISDIQMLYETLSSPDGTISNMALGEIADYIIKNDANECTPGGIEASVLNKLDLLKYGIKIEYIKVVGYAIVKTFRLIQDAHWTPDAMNMENKAS